MGWAVESQWLTLVLGLLGLAINAIVLAISFTWKISKVAEELREAALKHRDELRKDFLTRSDELKDSINSESKMIGETLQALRQKINDVELEAAKTYVRRDSWHQAMNQLQENIGKTDAADQQWRLRIEEKIDQLTKRILEQAGRGR